MDDSCRRRGDGKQCDATTWLLAPKAACSGTGISAFGCGHVTVEINRGCIRQQWRAHVLLALGVPIQWKKVTVSTADRKPNRDSAREDAPRHPANDPSGAEPAGASTGIPGRDFAGAEIAEAEADQARGRRESAATRDTALGPHDQESSA